MTLLANLRARRVAPAVAAEAAVYTARSGEAAALQLERFNTGWRDSLAASPWARTLKTRLDLPDRFESWVQFGRLVPVMRKADLRDVLAAVGPTREDVEWRATGGTTAEPMRFPVLASESAGAQVDMWLGRARLGLAPADRLFMIWGHAHLFGRGLKGQVARWKRRISDLALGYVRWSAYDLAPADLARAGDALVGSGARYVIGYATALDRFARANSARAAEFHRLGLSVVIATAEGFPHPDSRDAIADCFGCRVAMEYGTVETGAVAYERPSGGYDVFWGRHRLEAVEAGAGEARELLATSLYPRALPLLRYATGDLVRGEGLQAEPLTAFAAIQGRCNDIVALPDGAIVHSEAFIHALRDIPTLGAIQVVTRPSSMPIVRYEASQPLAEPAKALIRARLAQVNPMLETIVLERAEQLPRSPAGKHRMVISEHHD